MMVNLGMAMRAHMDGDTMQAIRRLGMAVEAIMQLIEEWSGAEAEVVVDGGAEDR